MAIDDDDFVARKRQIQEGRQGTLTNTRMKDGAEAPESLDELFKRIPVLIDQLEHLYRQFTTGLLLRPPVEERGRLDRMIERMTKEVKATPAARFRYINLYQSYTVHKSRWEKLLVDLESGKIKRIAGPKRGT